MKAIIIAGGKQYTVNEGDVIYIEKCGAEEGDTVTFDQVLAILEGEMSNFGSPTIKGASVTGKLVKNGKKRKIIVYKMKRRKGYRRKQGHRQLYSKVQIETIKV